MGDAGSGRKEVTQTSEGVLLKAASMVESAKQQHLTDDSEVNLEQTHDEDPTADKIEL